MACFKFADNTKMGRMTHSLKGSTAVKGICQDVEVDWQEQYEVQQKQKGREKPRATLWIWDDCLGRCFAVKGKFCTSHYKMNEDTLAWV